MSTTTTNFNLTKPELSDPADITNLNKNLDTIDQQLAIANKAFDALSEDGITYSVTVPGLNELYKGLKLTIVPSMTSCSKELTLNVNGMWSKSMIMPLSNTTTEISEARLNPIPTWLSANTLVKIIYDGDKWQTDFRLPAADRLSGTVPMTNGGTGATGATGIRTNLSFLSVNEVVITGEYPYEKITGRGTQTRVPITIPAGKTKDDIFMFRVDGVSNVSPYKSFYMWGFAPASTGSIQASTWRGDAEMVYGFLTTSENEDAVWIQIIAYDILSKAKVNIYENDGFKITRLVLYFK